MTEKFEQTLKFLEEALPTLRVVAKYIAGALATLFTSYLLASTLTAASLKLMTKAIISSAIAYSIDPNAKGFDFSTDFNHRDARKAVVDRNIFNSAGEVPVEEDKDEQPKDTKAAFDENAPCKDSNLGIELLGTIYMGDSSDSLATVKEKGYNEADIYRIGDKIIGHPEARVYRIFQDKLVINNAGSKECIEVTLPKNAKKIAAPQSQPPPASEPQPTANTENSSNESNHFVLEASYVEQSLGPGFSKILEAGRLVPHNKDNQMVGFKLIGVKANSLWRRVNLNSGDVITSVNDISMAKPDQGFALYQALQDTRDIRIEVLKGGSTPTTHTVEIK